MNEIPYERMSFAEIGGSPCPIKPDYMRALCIRDVTLGENLGMRNIPFGGVNITIDITKAIILPPELRGFYNSLNDMSIESQSNMRNQAALRKNFCKFSSVVKMLKLEQ